jgi:hypothetical protein
MANNPETGRKDRGCLKNCLRSQGHSWREIKDETGIARELHSGPFLACLKTYEFRLPTFLTGIASFQDPYLISGWFMGSHRAREGNARRPPSLICAGMPLGVPGVRFLALEAEGTT